LLSPVGRPEISPSPLAHFRQIGPRLLVWVGPLACGVGLLAYRMWHVLPWDRFEESLTLTLVSLLFAAALHRLRGWSWAHSLAGIWCAALVFFVGVLPVAAMLALAATAVAIGSLLTAQRSVDDALVALPIGLALIASCLGWLLPLHLHHRLVYLIVAGGVCIWRWRELRKAGLALYGGWRDSVTAAPLHAAIAVSLLGLASTGAWLPTMQADDLAYHLGLPSQLQRNGFYALDPSQQIWALAPWLGDVVQGVAQVLAGREARGAVDAMWLLLAAAGLGRLAIALRADARIAWLVVALFASQPLLAALAAGMQTELPATAMLAALALVIMQPPEQRGRKTLAGAALAGGLFALKFSQVIAALVMLIWALARLRARVDPKHLLAGMLLFAVVAGSSYFYAWQISGNPMLPLFNDLFRSPVMAAHQLLDTRWRTGFDALLPWSITFDTPRYLEAEPGGFGFVLVMFIGAWLVALWHSQTRGLAVAASAIMLLPLLPMQYARYAFPGMALLLPALLIAGSSTIGAKRFAGIALALCALNLAFQANAPWPLTTVARKRLLTNLGDADVVLRRFAPERVLIADLRKLDPTESIVLAMDGRAANIAELAGRGRTVSWYSPSFEGARIQADTDPSGERWLQLIDNSGAAWLLVRPDHLGDAQRAALMSGAAQRVAAVGEAELWSWKGPTARRSPAP